MPAHQVKKWEASDGSLHDTKREAELIDTKQKLTDSIFDVFVSTSGMTKKDIAELIFSNSEKIYTTLGLVVRDQQAIQRETLRRKTVEKKS